jgi:hypothetical protein
VLHVVALATSDLATAWRGSAPPRGSRCRSSLTRAPRRASIRRASTLSCTASRAASSGAACSASCARACASPRGSAPPAQCLTAGTSACSSSALHLLSLRKLCRRGARALRRPRPRAALWRALPGPRKPAHRVLRALRPPRQCGACARRLFVGATVWHRVCKYLARDPRLLGAGTAYSVVRCSFDITDALARGGAVVLPDVPPNFLRMWFTELVLADELPAPAYVAFLRGSTAAASARRRTMYARPAVLPF